MTWCMRPTWRAGSCSHGRQLCRLSIALPACSIGHCKRTFTSAFPLHQIVCSTFVAIGISSMKLYTSVRRLSVPRVWSHLRPSSSGAPEIPQAIPSKGNGGMIRSHLPPNGDRAPRHLQPPHWDWLGGPCSPPGSPPAETSCESHRPGRMEPSGEATGSILQLRNYRCKGAPGLRGLWKKVQRAIIPVLRLTSTINSGLTRRKACRLPKPRASKRWKIVATRMGS